VCFAKVIEKAVIYSRSLKAAVAHSVADYGSRRSSTVAPRSHCREKMTKESRNQRKISSKPRLLTQPSR
jgi:hypothetical protein